MNFIDALKVADAAMKSYAEAHPNWWKRLDGTPIQNDLGCHIANAIVDFAPQEAGRQACDRCGGRRLVEEGDPESGGNKVPCPACCGQEAGKADDTSDGYGRPLCDIAEAGKEAGKAVSTPEAYRADLHVDGCYDEHCPGCVKEAGKVEAVADERQPSDGDYLRWAEQAGAKINWDFESASSARVVFLTASQWGRFCDKVRALHLRPSQQALSDAKDAARYRHIRSMAPKRLRIVDIETNTSFMEEHADEAIDAAILAAAGGSEK